VFFVRPETKNGLSEPKLQLPWEGEEIDLNPTFPDFVLEKGKGAREVWASDAPRGSDPDPALPAP
jgi:hypothetical protein